ncbi:hypothetical protein HRE53_25505 [Acaryochloris sp. 'Moss Beach']|uniref:hypothetical protein n=1 Tax=Acaryochloris sp. 'Moss Beach' TaxID=2740837 RepID=UPI001F37F40A|nr:hypothetical protein [Acaryochloris sp. 'Moss Beach']UJB69621.1 hypothetical protein HRE53_25505 [Acaryochloris sp. 'Moss Beach']
MISLDWTLGHHERSKQIFGVKRQYDYVDNCMSCYQTILTAVAANRVRQDGIGVAVQAAQWEAAELEYLKMTRQGEYETIAAAMERLSELVAYQHNRDAYQTRTELLSAMIEQIEGEGQFPTADYAFDAGVCAADLTTVIEGFGRD